MEGERETARARCYRHQATSPHHHRKLGGQGRGRRERVKGVRGSESEEDEDGSADIGGRGVESLGFTEGNLLRNMGDEG